MNADMNRTLEYIQNRTDISPKLGLILGSGLGEYAETVVNKQVIPYSEIPDFPVSTAPGHAGRFVFGNCMDYPTIMMQGRFHYYEGYSKDEIVLPVRLMKKLGVEVLIITNAAGGINEQYVPGDLMIIKDHINFAGINPLIGPNRDEYGVRFPDMTNAYDKELQRIIHKSAVYESIDIKEGIYAMMTGPSYETPAEIRMLRTIGADAVGMSTVPEVIAAVHCGIRVAGISCISNMAAGILDRPLHHQEVIDTAELIKDKFMQCLNRVILNIQ